MQFAFAPVRVDGIFAPERADEFIPWVCWQLMQFAFVPGRADKLCSLHLHLSVLKNLAPERADKHLYSYESVSPSDIVYGEGPQCTRVWLFLRGVVLL